jgi:hypothetical protein
MLVWLVTWKLSVPEPDGALGSVPCQKPTLIPPPVGAVGVFSSPQPVNIASTPTRIAFGAQYLMTVPPWSNDTEVDGVGFQKEGTQPSHPKHVGREIRCSLQMF